MNLVNILNSIDQFVLLINFCVFLVSITHAKQVQSFFISNVILLIVNSFSYWLLNILLLEEPSQLMSYSWYYFFAIINLLAIILINYFHRNIGYKLSRISKAIVLALSVLTWILVIRCIDRFILGTDLLNIAYQLFIPAINIGLAILTVCYVTKLKLKQYMNYWKGSH